MTRRGLLQASLGAALLPRGAILDPNQLPKFVDPLPRPPLARPTANKLGPDHRPLPLYQFAMRQISRKVHRNLPPTTMWGIDSSSPGPTIEARCGQPIYIRWINALPREHLLPIDHSIMGAEPPIPDVRAIFHVHGARVPPESDGYPENWFTSGQSLTSFYPNQQDAAMLWYHDHAMAITRLNTYAGLFGVYLLRDDTEDALNLPKGAYEIPLVLFDRSFRRDGRLYYPVSDNPSKPWVSEFSGDAVLANGTLFPFLDVEPRPYRFRLVNASNSRFLYLSLSSKQEFVQIGSDQGLLASPVELPRITLAPGERADVLLGFQSQHGREITLHSDDVTILQFRVSHVAQHSHGPLPHNLRSIPKLVESDAVATRWLTLESGADEDDPTSMSPMLLNGAHWSDPVTESPRLNSVELWSFINLTDDAHPIHLHLVRFQILDRRPFDLFTYLNEKKLRYTAAAIPPDANETGWKDTVRANPGMVTRIIIRFEGFAGRYVWHCHVLEHEDNQMMRPYDVLPAGA